MYINQIDELFNSILDKFYKYLLNEKKLNEIYKETNFVRYQIDIVNIITKFINTISRIEIEQIVKNEKNINHILNIIKRYCAFYIYLIIGYHYIGNRDLFITNILECSKNQHITSFFSSNNNSKIINYFTDIKNIIGLAEYKTIDQVKILLQNNPIKYNSIIQLFSELGEDYVINNFLIKDNVNLILKTFILKMIYLKEDKIELNALLNQIEQKEGEYKYIEIVTANKNKIVDFNVIQKFVSLYGFKRNLSEDIYSYLEENIEYSELVIRNNEDFVNFLFTNKILIPITEDFIRYHKDTEKYESDTRLKEDTKIKVVINKVNNVRNYYSPLLEKNPKLKLETKNLFYKNLEHRYAVLYNDDEEIKIIQKLEYADKKNENDYLIDLEDLRKYAYVNFKHASKDHIKIRTPNTIEAIRYNNLKNKKNDLLETRIGHDNISLNVVGVAWNPSRFKMVNTPNLKPLECFSVNNLINVSKKQKNNNGYLGFINIFNKTILNNKNKNLFYWLFDSSKDIPKNIKEYNDFSTSDAQKNIKLLLYEVYLNYIENVKNKFKSYVEKSKKSFNIFSLDYLFKIYQEKYFDFELNPNFKNKLLYDILSKNIREIKITEDENDNIIPGMRKDMIKLPVVDIKKSKKNIIIVQEKKELDTEEIVEESFAKCNHYRKWDSINEFFKYSKSSEDFNQMIFDFVKKYVKENDKGEYLCKSCNEGLLIKKFVSEGFYNKDNEEFMTSSIIINQRLDELPKYMKLNRTIKNLEKNLEKIAYIAGLNSYLGNTPVIKLHRKNIIKDTIDLILLHTEYLKNQPKERIVNAEKNYGIIKGLSNLFFFELKDEIFLTSSADTDYYKKIKYNNVLAYFIFILIIELNPGQILGFKDDKMCNFFFYSKVSQALFNGLYIRFNQNKIQINKIPLLAYVIYYFSCLMVTNKLWLSQDNTEEKTFNINMQKSIIHTVIDLINSVIEANLLPAKNYLYELFNTRFTIKIKNLFTDTTLINRVTENSNKNFKVDEKTNKIIITKKIINNIDVENNKEDFFNNINNEYCLNSKFQLKQYKYRKANNTFDILNNCDDGNLHQWSVTTGELICSLCNKKYNDLLNNANTTVESEKSLNQYYDKLKLIQIKKIANKHCLSGDLHIFVNGVCSLCGINPLTYEYKEKELLSLYKKIEDIENNDFIKKINILKQNKNKILETEKENHTIKNKFLKRYEKEYSINYIEDFVERLVKILGPKIKSDNKTIYLKQTLWIINHDYLGNELKKPIEFLSSDNIIQEQLNHPINNKDVYYYKDNNNKVYVYYDIVTLQYLGYSEDNKKLKTNKNVASLIKELSIRDSLFILGLENEYYNLSHLVSDYDVEQSTLNNNNVINNMIRNRILNLKQIISSFESIINGVRNHTRNNRFYNQDKNKILNEFTKKIKDFKLKDKDNHNGIFKHSIYLLKLLNMKKINNIDIQVINKKYINTKFLSKLQTTDSKLVYYLIYNLNKLLDYNSENIIESELAHLIIKTINYVTKLYYKDYSNIDIRKFDYIITNEAAPVIDTNIASVGIYNELVNENEIDQEQINEKNYDAQEAKDAYDIDDYEVDDDIDGSTEAFDGYEN